MSLFRPHQKVFIGVVHLQPLPGSPRWGGDLEKVIRFALEDARNYEVAGADAVFIENFGDVPFTKGRVGPETIAAMTAAGREIRAAVEVPIGFNVLRNDPCAALALCAACGGTFIRVNVHTGAMLTDQGIIEGNAFETLRFRNHVAPGVQIFSDVHVKHAVPLGNTRIADAARDSIARGLADGVIISGVGTGYSTDRADLEAVRSGCPDAKILIGSGADVKNVKNYLDLVDGFIVGTSLKAGSKISSRVDPKRVAAFARALR